MKFYKQGMADFFNKTEKSSFGEPVETVERLADLLPPGSSVLDLGAGDGRNALFLAEKGFKVSAIDLSEAGIEKLRRLATQQNLIVETHIADAAMYSIDKEYDAFVVVLLFQFLNETASLRLLTEMKQHTSPGGVHMIHVFTQTGDRQHLDLEEHPEIQCFYPEDGWLKEFYADWEMIEYSSSTGALIGKFKPDGSPMTNVVERIVVRKPMI